MHLDIRLPMGLFFLVTGVLLVGYGLTVDPGVYVRHSLGQNVNVRWGLVFAAFGIVMLWLTRHARGAAGKNAALRPPRPPSKP